MDLYRKSWKLEKFEGFTVLENGREIEEFLKRKKASNEEDGLYLYNCSGLGVNGQDWMRKLDPTAGVWFSFLAAKSELELTPHLIRKGREQSTTRVFITACEVATRQR